MMLVEPCCGTAALTLHLLGARRQIVPRQGSKWRLRRELAALVGDAPPDRVVLSDASPWAMVVAEVLGDRRELLDALRRLVERGERSPGLLHAELHGRPIPNDRPHLAAQLLWLQRMAFAGKCVRVVDGRWSSPGINLTSALGVAGTDRFGPVRPLGRALLSAVEGAPHADVEASVGLARPAGEAPGTVVYIDPPYAGTTGYGPDDLTRSQVVELAREWSAAGAIVVVSEAGPIQELGWESAALTTVGGQRETQLFKAGHRAEWVTWKGSGQLGLFGRAA